MNYLLDADCSSYKILDLMEFAFCKKNLRDIPTKITSNSDNCCGKIKYNRLRNEEVSTYFFFLNKGKAAYLSDITGDDKQIS